MDTHELTDTINESVNSLVPSIHPANNENIWWFVEDLKKNVKNRYFYLLIIETVQGDIYS